MLRALSTWQILQQLKAKALKWSELTEEVLQEFEEWNLARMKGKTSKRMKEKSSASMTPVDEAEMDEEFL